MDTRSTSRTREPSRYKKYDSYISRGSTRNRVTSTTARTDPMFTRSDKSNKDVKVPLNQKLRSSPSRSKNTRQSIFQSANAIILKAVKHSTYDPKINRNVILSYVKPKKTSLVLKGYYAIGTAVFVLATALTTQAFIFNRQAKDQINVLGASNNLDAQGVEQGTGDEPAESKPDDNAVYSYQVASDKIRYLRIPTKSINARVKELGLTSTGAVDAPWSIHDVGWFNGSIVPGSKNGVSLILGHVSGRTMPGVFKTIGELEVGEIVEVEKGNGDVLKFVVEKVEEYPLDSIDMKKILYGVEKGTQSMRLMTCGGTYDSLTRSYLSRTVVYTVPL